MRMIFGIILSVFSLGTVTADELCELEVSKSVECIAPSDLRGDTLTFKNALTRVSQSGVVFCAAKESIALSQTAVLYMIDRSSANNNTDKNNSRIKDIIASIEYQRNQYPSSYVGFMDFAGSIGDVFNFTPVEDFDESGIKVSKKMNGRASYNSLERAGELVTDFKDENPDMNVVIYYITDKESSENLNRITRGLSGGDAFTIDPENGFDTFYMINSVATNGATSMLVVSGDTQTASIVNDGNNGNDNNIFNRISIPEFNLLEVLKSNLEVSMNHSKPTHVKMINRDTKQSVTTQSIVKNGEGNWGIELSSVLPLQEGYNTLEFEVSYNNWTTVTKTVTIDVLPKGRVGDAQTDLDVFDLECHQRSALSFVNSDEVVITSINKLEPHDLILYTHDHARSSEIVLLGTGSSSDMEFWTVEYLQSKGVYKSAPQISFDLNDGTEDNNTIEVNDPDVIMAFWKHAVDPRDTAFARLVFSSKEEFESGELNDSLRDSILDEILGEGASDEKETPFVVNDSGELVVPGGSINDEKASKDSDTEKEHVEDTLDEGDNEDSTLGSEQVVVASETTFLDYSKDPTGDVSYRDADTESMTVVSKQTEEGMYTFNENTRTFERVSPSDIEEAIGQLISVDIAYPEGGSMVWDAMTTIQISYFSTDSQFLKYFSFTDVAEAMKEGEESSHMRYVFEWLPTIDTNGHRYLTLDNGRKVGSGVIIMQVKQTVTFTLRYDFKEKKKGTNKYLENTNVYTFGYARPDAQ
ncbi:MAG: hypothetical protein OCC49_01440 [Fibrobacterales bacterium]